MTTSRESASFSALSQRFRQHLLPTAPSALQHQDRRLYHQILNSPPSIGDLILPHRMADHRVDINTVENPMQLFRCQHNDRHLPAGPPELVLSHHHKTGPIKKQQLHPAVTAIAKGKNRRSKGNRSHHLLHQYRKAIDACAKVDRLAILVDLEFSVSMNMTQRSDDLSSIHLRHQIPTSASRRSAVTRSPSLEKVAAGSSLLSEAALQTRRWPQ
ncbi:hypothetical protein [Rhizobium grahamii]|uniref:hypothetical protein n=1 Tax=Rhizobium grahamii TaxID=1120045 RepID=UPI001FD5991F|nr:hypothetical protein [Rhizobium grahamii]